jgi:transglutaminase-like putative cysteine protease
MTAMPLPHWIPAVAILYWGFQINALGLAVPLAAMLVAPGLVRQRFTLGRAEFHRALDVCWVLALAGILLAYSRESVGNVLRSFAVWLPVVLLPGFLAQAWSVANRVPVSALAPFPAFRRRAIELNSTVDLGPAMVAAAILAASFGGANQTWLFYLGAIAVLGVALWARRSAGYGRIAAVALILVAAIGGWFVAQALASAQQWVEEGVFAWTSKLHRASSPSRFSRTAIGRQGPVGGSGRIIFQVADDGPRSMPRLFRTAVYSSWADGVWYAPRSGFNKLDGTDDDWILDGEPRLAGAVEVEWSRAATGDLIPLPAGALALRDLAADSVERTPLGAVRVEARAGLVSFRAEHGSGAGWELDPEPRDLEDPPAAERKVIEAVARELGLHGVSPEEAKARIGAHFERNFRYTTDLIDPPSRDPAIRTPLGRFLVEHRSGHCEYFATAAVLLLRAAGTPARYAVGYAISSERRSDGWRTVRGSDGHAWVRMWNGTQWVDFDPTPPAHFEPEVISGWQGRLRQQWHDFWFTVHRWWWLGEKRVLRQAHWLAAPFLLGLLWHFRRLRTANQQKGAASNRAFRAWPGADSEWFEVERNLAREGWGIRQTETRSEWRERLEAGGWSAADLRLAGDAVSLHERLRFHPQGLAPDERLRLRELSTEFLNRTRPRETAQP